MSTLETLMANLAREHTAWEAKSGHRFGPDAATALVEVPNFGTDPGRLRMLEYVPETVAPGAPLVVVLHGCTQTAAGYDRGAGWSALAARFGFALLYPEQRRANNANGCFNWFRTEDVARGGGEVESIRQMMEHMLSEHGLDRRRVFVTGLSAGGAMTAALLAAYPEVFAAGAIIAGLPVGGVASTGEAMEAMRTGAPRGARAWGDLVRRASPHRGPWPVVQVWHGDADHTVSPANADALVLQWTDVHGVAGVAPRVDRVSGVPHRVWLDGQGRPVVEAYRVAGLGHGTPIGPQAAEAEQRGGVAGPFMLDCGVGSSWLIARSWGLIGAERAGRGVRVEERGTAASPRAGMVPAGVAGVISKALRSAGLVRG